MRLLFEIDKKDYNENGTKCIRPSVRGIIIKGDKIAMVHSLKYDYYKFPGGGMKNGEEKEETLIREVKEESGLIVIPETIREYGLVKRRQKGKIEDIFIQDNYYYLCKAKDSVSEQKLDDYEAEEAFTLEFVTPDYAIKVNDMNDHGSKTDNPMYRVMIERESRVLKMLLEEGYFQNGDNYE